MLRLVHAQRLLIGSKIVLKHYFKFDREILKLDDQNFYHERSLPGLCCCPSLEKRATDSCLPGTALNLLALEKGGTPGWISLL